MGKDSEKTGPALAAEAPQQTQAIPMPVSQAFQQSTGNGPVALDLVVVIDTSGSMSDEAKALSDKIDAAIAAAATKCPAKFRITFLGIQGTWPGTKFDQSASDYLIQHGAAASNLQAREPFKESDGKDHAGNKEDLCRAVIDISKYFDWRDDAMRSIFVLGDEGMEGGGGKLTSAAVEKNKEAIQAAQENHVRVYTYQGTPDPNSEDMYPSQDDMDAVTAEYQRLAAETFGRSYIYTTGIADFQLVLEQILCDSLKPLPSDNPGQGAAPCSSVCEQLPVILSTVNTLADIMKTAISACCGTSSADGSHGGNGHAGCSCSGKKP
jgi:hypothetical protein